MTPPSTIFCGVAIVLGIFGTVIPSIPGLLLSWAGVLLWALFTDAGQAKWWVARLRHSPGPVRHGA